MAKPHPLDPLTPAEITKTAELVREAFPRCGLNYRVITLKEPSKSLMVPFLEREHGHKAVSVKTPTRTAMAQVLVLPKGQDTTKFIELKVDLDAEKIIHQEHLVGKHPFLDSAYMQAVEAACMADPRVKAEIETLKLPKGATVVVEPWAYATDGMNDMSKRISMCWFYMRLTDHLDANFYAHPLDICAEVSEDLKVVQVYRLPSGEHDSISDTIKEYDHTKIHRDSEYHPDLRQNPRHTTKPLQIIQPEGPSFETDRNLVSWEKWTFRVGFNYREGLTLHDIRYDGRSVFYRLSLSEMFVPYGDSRSPYPRKGAFDLGNDGAGINANNLKLGCDCLGVIKYFDGWHNTSSGEPLKLPNVVCCHEVDDGILWKHTNHRTGNAVVTRSRILVLQTIITVSNYEYVFAFHFSQDASIHYEVRATGIMSTCPIDVGDRVPFGTIVAPGVMAPFHQHLFSLRIDPAIDGHNNSLEIEESIPMPYQDPSVHNPFGVGYTTTSEILSVEGPLDLDFKSNRVFKIVNENKINTVTGTPVGYKLVPCYSQMLLSHPSSHHSLRSEFASHAIWVTRYSDDEAFPAGKYTMQSAGGEGIKSWIQNRKTSSMSSPSPSSASANSVRNQDIVIWHTFGSTHNPRVEDWPVMPCEKMVVGLKPVNFFTGNPAADVAVSTQEKGRSVLVKDKADVQMEKDEIEEMRTDFAWIM